ncbi:Homeobox-leucine zipper protein HAT14 [Linum perenne]
MELALSLGDASKPFKFLDKSAPKLSTNDHHLGFCMGLSGVAGAAPSSELNDGGGRRVNIPSTADPQPSLQLDLLPFSPVPRRQTPATAQPSPEPLRFPWLVADPAQKETSQNRRLSAEEGDDGASLSSPNSAATSSFRMEFGIGGFGFPSSNKRDLEEGERANASEDDENGSGRKKLRLSKDQSAFLEESFKEHNTLNPKQKLALAKQLNLRPRQVEVWFQNRRARTKLKQTEVDCEYLKRCCETLTEENRRLQKELQELRALKTSQPFYMQLPATTLTMCPSCERVATTTSAAAATAAAAAATSTTTNSSSTTLSLGKVGSSSSNGKVCPFPSVQLQMSQSSSQPSS